MSLYLDTNIVYSFVFADAHSARTDAWMALQTAPVLVADWTKVEFYALVGRRERGGDLDAHVADMGRADFERFVATQTQGLALTHSAGAIAIELASDPRLKLFATDALHLACAAEGGHVLVTFDARLAEAARMRGFACQTP